MRDFLKMLFVVLPLMTAGFDAFAQSVVTGELLDSKTGEPVGFATVSLGKVKSDKPVAYSLSGSDGKFKIEKVKPGTYVFKAELMGYVTFSREITLKDKLDLGKLKMQIDRQTIKAASVSAVGNPMTVKKDTLEFNANAYKTTDNDALEDLLRKIPGIEISENGSITHNGVAIEKITIDGKTFFLDDPQLASKNLPAKIISKVKVLEKKSEQAEFTGIDDGEGQTIIDLSIKPGMMNGMFGNVMAGGGHDVPKPGTGSSSLTNDWRYQAAGFLGRFAKDSQVSVLINGNNTNNRGFNDLAGSMMQGMRGGGGGMGRGQGGWGGGNGITTSYMAGVNGVFDLLDNRMELGGNYMFTGTENDVRELGAKTTYLSDRNLIYDSEGVSNSRSWGNRFGVRLDHKFNDNTSILFEPQVSFGGGQYAQSSVDTTTALNLADRQRRILSNSLVNNAGWNHNVDAGGRFLLRQRLGIPGRTMTVMLRGSITDNDLNGSNFNTTHSEDENVGRDTVKQTFANNTRSYSAMGRITYTEPLGGHFYIEANYAYNWNKSESDKVTYDLLNGGNVDYTYSNHIINRSGRHDIGVNMLYQIEKLKLQVGAAAMPTNTYNSTTKWDDVAKTYKPKEYYDSRWNFSPRAMVIWDISDNSNLRYFYRGNSSQPSTSQLMPVPDNTDPMNIGFGNPTLTPYFSHRMNADVRYNNKKSFASFNIRANAGLVQNPIVNTLWYGTNGAQFSMPFNGPDNYNASVNTSFTIPIAKSNFSVSNVLNGSISSGSSFVGTNIDMSVYEREGYYAFMEDFINKFNDKTYFAEHIAVNTTNTLSAYENLRFTYRTDALEVNLAGGTRMHRSWYTISKNADNTLTWNNRVTAGVNWTWQLAGMAFKADFNYNWYRGYSVPQDDEYVLDAEIQKMFYKNKFTLALKCYDILGNAKNLTVSDSSNFHNETINNTLGRYIILSLTYRFGTFDSSRMRGPGGQRGPGGMGPGPRM